MHQYPSYFGEKSGNSIEEDLNQLEEYLENEFNPTVVEEEWEDDVLDEISRMYGGNSYNNSRPKNENNTPENNTYSNIPNSNTSSKIIYKILVGLLSTLVGLADI